MTEAIGLTTITGRKDKVINESAIFMQMGFYIKDVESNIDWPYFWRRVYTVTLECHIVYDAGKYVALPSTDKLFKELT